MSGIKGRCRKCGSTDLYFYDGALGYEAIVCRRCGTHHTNDNPIKPLRKITKRRKRRSPYIVYYKDHIKISKSGVVRVMRNHGLKVWNIRAYKGHTLMFNFDAIRGELTYPKIASIDHQFGARQDVDIVHADVRNMVGYVAYTKPIKLVR